MYIDYVIEGNEENTLQDDTPGGGRPRCCNTLHLYNIGRFVYCFLAMIAYEKLGVMIASAKLAVMIDYETCGFLFVAMPCAGPLGLWVLASYTFCMYVLPGCMGILAPVSIAASSNIHYSSLWAIAICIQSWYAIIQGPAAIKHVQRNVATIATLMCITAHWSVMLFLWFCMLTVVLALSYTIVCCMGGYIAHNGVPVDSC